MLKKIIQKFTVVILLILFAGYYISTTFFTHTHYVNGSKIVHSHFYLKKDFPLNQDKKAPVEHQHTESELTLISILSVIHKFSIIVIILSLLLFHKFWWKKYIILNYRVIPLDCYIHSLSLRAPPHI